MTDDMKGLEDANGTTKEHKAAQVDCKCQLDLLKSTM
jgi:hypothetical protein